MNVTKDNILIGEKIEFRFEKGLGHLQKMLLEMHGNKVIQIDAESDEPLTAIMALKKSTQLAKKLVELGVRKGDVVTINSRNSIEYNSVPMACFHIGAIFSPLNPDYTSRELDHVVNISQPKVAFCSAETLKLMLKLRQDHRFLNHLILFGDSVRPCNNVIMYKDIIRGVTAVTDFRDFPPVELDPGVDVATIMYSSGTTGLPKGVMATHRNITTMLEIAHARLLEDIKKDDFSQQNISFALAPMFHSMGFYTIYFNGTLGNLRIVLRQFRAKQFLESIEKYKVNILTVPPAVVLVLMKHPLVTNYDLSSLRQVRTGAAPISKEMEQEVLQRFKLKSVSQTYGMTETVLGVLMSSSSEFRSGSVGRIVHGMMGKVVNGEGKALGPNQEGELCFKGPVIMKGYMNDPAATAETIDADGWLHTGDVGYFDSDYYFYIVDRIKDLIKYNGFQVAPAELEALLLQHPQVADAGVIGLPDPEAGELPLAYVVRKPGAKVTEKQLQDYIAERVSRQKRLRGGVHFIEEIPKNQLGKILRRVLKQRAIAALSNSKL